MKFLCKIGLHNWHTGFNRRTCNRCSLVKSKRKQLLKKAIPFVLSALIILFLYVLFKIENNRRADSGVKILNDK